MALNCSPDQALYTTAINSPIKKIISTEFLLIFSGCATVRFFLILLYKKLVNQNILYSFIYDWHFYDIYINNASY